MIADHKFTGNSASENLAAHRAHLLLTLLPKAIVFGATEALPDHEPLTVLSSFLLLLTQVLMYCVRTSTLQQSSRGWTHHVASTLVTEALLVSLQAVMT